MTELAERVNELVGATEEYDQPRAEALVYEIVRSLWSADAIAVGLAKQALNALKKQNYFDLMIVLGDAILQTGQTDPAVRRLYAQALIGIGALSAAIAFLERLVAESGGNQREEFEARGLLGRAYKQAYVNNGEMSPLRRKALLSKALASYYDVYRHSAGELWHGINTVALLARARRDGVAISDYPEPTALARDILGNVEQFVAETRAMEWDLATAAEACVALAMLEKGQNPAEHWQAALRWLARYVDSSQTGAFELASTLRQFMEVWQLGLGDGTPGSSLLILLRASLLDKPDGGRIDLDAHSASVSRDDAHLLEQVLGHEKYQTLEWYRTGLERSRGVARLGSDSSLGTGTGFLVSAAAFGQGKGWLLVTNAHVLSENSLKALRPHQAKVTFEALDGGREVYGVKELLWTSPRGELDTTVARLDRHVKGVTPFPIVETLPSLLLGDPARLYVIGHPRGGTLSFSMDDNLFLDHADPLIHYRAPTESGSSGSPVFNRQWGLIGLHHSGSKDMPRLGTKRGTYPANEGIYIGAIRKAFLAARA